MDRALRLNVFWRIVLMFGVATLIWVLVQTAVTSLWGEDYSRLTHALRAVAIFGLAVPTVMAARRFLDGGSLRGLGLQPLREGWWPFLVGIAVWLIPAAAGFALCLFTGIVSITTGASPSEIFFTALGLAGLVVMFEAFPEELIFRGYIYHNLALARPLWIAVAGQALLFTVWGMLNGGEITVDRSILFLVFGMLVGTIRAITGSVWATIGYHLAFQTIAQLFGSVGGLFDVGSPQTLLFAFGLAPFAVSLLFLRWFYKDRPNWQGREQGDY